LPAESIVTICQTLTTSVEGFFCSSRSNRRERVLAIIYSPSQVALTVATGVRDHKSPRRSPADNASALPGSGQAERLQGGLIGRRPRAPEGTRFAKYPDAGIVIEGTTPPGPGHYHKQVQVVRNLKSILKFCDPPVIVSHDILRLRLQVVSQVPANEGTGACLSPRRPNR
jgi:hypothetical protein